MKWLVCINDEGIQCKIPTGKGDLKKAAKEQKALEKQSKIMFAFEYEGGGRDPEGDYQDAKAFKAFLKEKTAGLHKKYGAASPEEFFGYKMRKQYALGNGLEVLSNLDDADDYSEFSKNYGGIQGAIDVLLNTERVMTGATKDPAKAVSKLIRKLEIEAED